MALQYRKRLIVGIIAIFLASGFQLAIPILIGSAVDAAIGLDGGTVDLPNGTVMRAIDSATNVFGKETIRQKPH